MKRQASAHDPRPLARPSLLGALMTAVMSGAVSVAFAAGADVSLTRRADKTYEVSGRFTVDASTAVVWGVLTDYDGFPAFVSSMRSSRVRETRGDGSLLVEQKASGAAFFLSRTMRILLEVRRSPGRLRFTDVGRRDFQSYEGDWRVEAAPQGAHVAYHLLARPRFLAPSFLIGRAMTRGARNLLDEVRAEIVRRAAAVPAR